MIDDQLVHNLFQQLEKELRKGDDEIASARTPNGRKRSTKRRNALNAACNALYRFKLA